MQRKGRKLELDYKDLYELDKKYYNIESPAALVDKITGEKREIDVLVKYKDDNGNERLIAIECRDHKKNQNVLWIEQLIQKKVDLGLDILVAATSTNFSRSAIKKAQYYGVFLERAESIDKVKIEELSKEFFCDVFYIITRVKKLNFILKNSKEVSIKELFRKLDFTQQQDIMKSLNDDLFLNFNFNSILENSNIKHDDFFKVQNCAHANCSGVVFANKNVNEAIKKNQIVAARYELDIVPHRLSLPLSQSMSIFFVDGKNKSHKVCYGTEDENITLGYISNEKIVVNIHLKERKYHRVVGGEMCVNTIFPKNAEIELNFDNEEKTIINSFNFEENF